MSNLGNRSNGVSLGYSPDGQVQQGYGPVSVGQAGQGYGVPFASMSETQQRQMKDTEGGWGPRELDGAHNQQEYYGPQEVAAVEKATELPVGIEVAELSSGWEDAHGGDGHGNGRPGTNGGRR